MGSLRKLFFGRVPCAVADLLRADPEGWSDTGPPWWKRYDIRHRSGITLWVANDCYGIHVDGPRCGRWGSVSFLSSFGLSPGHWLLWFSYRTWAKSHPFPGRHDSLADKAEAALSDALNLTDAGERALMVGAQ